MQATTLEQDLVALERQFWNGDAAFYRKHLDEKCLTVFEEMAGVFNKDDVAQQAGEGNRWQIQQVQPEGFPPADRRHRDRQLRSLRQAQNRRAVPRAHVRLHPPPWRVER